MTFIDYVTLMLVNMVGGLLVLAFFLWRDVSFEPEMNQHWAPAFAVPGLIAAVCGFAMTFTWPIPSPYNIAFGETSAMFGLLLLGASWALAKGWKLLPLSIYAFVAGLTAVVLGIRISDLGLTSNPALSALGFVLTGSGGVFAGLVLRFKYNSVLRRIGSIVLLSAAAIWLYTGVTGYWAHLVPPKQL